MIRFRLVVEAVDNNKEFKEDFSDVIYDDCSVVVKNMNNRLAIDTAHDLMTVLSTFYSR